MDDNTLQTLVDQGELDEAKRYIESIFIGTNEGKASDNLTMISSYISALNDVNEQYVATLEDALNSLKEVDSSEREASSTYKLMNIREKLNS